jgi:hypothetical protein
MIEDPRQPGSGKMIMDVESEMGKKQKAKAEEFLRRHIDKQLGRKETKTEPSTSSKNEVKQRNQQIGVRDLWNDIYTEPTIEGKNKIVNSILSSPYIKDSRNPVTGINFLTKRVGGTDAKPEMQEVLEVSYLDPQTNRTGDNAIVIGENPTSKEWASIGIEIHGLDKESDFMGTLNKDSKWSGSVSGSKAKRGSNKVDNVSQVRNQVKTMIGNTIKDFGGFVNMSDNDVATELQSKLGALGFTFKPDSSPFNEVLVTYPGGEKPYVLKVGSGGSEEQTENFLNFILPLISKEAADIFIESGADITKGNTTGGTTEIKGKKKLPGQN